MCTIVGLLGLSEERVWNSFLAVFMGILLEYEIG